MLSGDLVEAQDDISIFEQSSPESLRARSSLSPPAHDQQSSTSDGRTPNADTEDDYFPQHRLKQCSSSRSSISSFPASVIHNTLLTDHEDGGRMSSNSLGRPESPAYRLNGPGYMSAFRNPSSVRALQLGESEYTDTDTLSIARNHRLRRSPKISYFSPRSPGSTQSSPTKRSSRPGTPQQRSSSKLKKEFPLVLLHCTILPPAIGTRMPQVSDDIYEAVLPEEYKKRWRTLQDKVAKNSEVRQRGILISHPHEDYVLLEERLLETLELERPRIRQHHFLGPKNTDATDSGFESSSQADEGSDSEREAMEKCPDCGKAVSCKIEQERKWQVKVYAANGLMKGDAWAAVWQEMEKVDVEVGVWMPEDVRTEVDERLTALQAKHEAEKPVDEPPPSLHRRRRSKNDRAKSRHDERMKEIYGDAGLPRTQDEIDGLGEETKIRQEEEGGRKFAVSEEEFTRTVEPSVIPDRRPHVTFAPDPVHRRSHDQPNISTLIRHQVNAIMQDQKSLAIMLLSMLVLFFAIQNTSTERKSPTAVNQAIPTPESLAVPEQPVMHTTRKPEISYVTTTIFATHSAVQSVDPDATSARAVEGDAISGDVAHERVVDVADTAALTQVPEEQELEQSSDHDVMNNSRDDSEWSDSSSEVGTRKSSTEQSTSAIHDTPAETTAFSSDAKTILRELLGDHGSAIIEARASSVLPSDPGPFAATDEQITPELAHVTNAVHELPLAAMDFCWRSSIDHIGPDEEMSEHDCKRFDI